MEVPAFDFMQPEAYGLRNTIIEAGLRAMDSSGYPLLRCCA
jgi:hypothetical protein